jgi:hypothetical protein
MSVKYLQSAGGLVVDIDNFGGATIGSALQVLEEKAEANQWWTMVPVPGWPGYFWIQSSDGDLVVDIDNTGGVKSGSRLQALDAKNETNQYWKTVDVPGHAGYFWIASAVGSLVIDIDNSGGVKSGSRLQALNKKSESNQYWKWVEVPQVAAPSGGLGSWSNYFLCGGDTASGDYIPLQDVGIEITITEDLVGSPPLSFQLNALSPEKKKSPQFLDAWQQYGISMIPGTTKLNSFANNWSVAGLAANPKYSLFNVEPNGFVTLANQTTIPKGSIITISLNPLPPTPGVVGGTYVGFATNYGAQPLSQLIDIVGQPLTTPSGGVATYKDLAPIVAMQLVLVGWAGRADTIFSSGAGTIRYYSSTPMTVLSAKPTDTETDTVTGETSNSTYGTLPSGKSSIFVQSFNISTGGPRIARPRKGHARPSRFIPQARP